MRSIIDILQCIQKFLGGSYKFKLSRISRNVLNSSRFPQVVDTLNSFPWSNYMGSQIPLNQALTSLWCHSSHGGGRGGVELTGRWLNLYCHSYNHSIQTRQGNVIVAKWDNIWRMQITLDHHYDMTRHDIEKLRYWRCRQFWGCCGQFRQRGEQHSMIPAEAEQRSPPGYQWWNPNITHRTHTGRGWTTFSSRISVIEP